MLASLMGNSQTSSICTPQDAPPQSSPFCPWQDLPDVPDIDENDNNKSSNMSTISVDNQQDPLTLPIPESNLFHFTVSMSEDSAQPLTTISRSPAKTEVCSTNLERTRNRNFYSDLSTISAPHPFHPCAQNDGIDSEFLRETHTIPESVSPLAALAAVAEQHQKQVTDRSTASTTASRLVFKLPRSSTCLAANTNSGWRADCTEHQNGWGNSGSRTSLGEFGDSKNQRASCDVCGERASGHYFGALVCLPCKSFFIRCTKGGRLVFSSHCGGKCDVRKSGRIRCQFCRFQKCLAAGMHRKEKPEAITPEEGQILCKVCNDIANGLHFGVSTCEGCKKFFRRGLKEHQSYICKTGGKCAINPRMRNNCRYCRYRKCLLVGMSRDAIKMGRPKKGEMSSLHAVRSSDTAVRPTADQSHHSMVLSEMIVEDDCKPQMDSFEGQYDEALENKLTPDTAHDTNYFSDEFLEAVSINFGDELNVKKESEMVLQPGTCEEVQFSPSLSASSVSPVSSVESPERCSPGSADTKNSTAPFSSAAGDFHQTDFTFLQSNVSARPQQHQMETRTNEDTQSIGSGHFPTSCPLADCMECCKLLPSSINASRPNCVLSQSCYCQLYLCTYPVRQCDSPNCLAESRSQLRVQSSDTNPQCSSFPSSQLPSSAHGFYELLGENIEQHKFQTLSQLPLEKANRALHNLIQPGVHFQQCHQFNQHPDGSGLRSTKTVYEESPMCIPGWSKTELNGQRMFWDSSTPAHEFKLEH